MPKAKLEDLPALSVTDWLSNQPAETPPALRLDPVQQAAEPFVRGAINYPEDLAKRAFQSVTNRYVYGGDYDPGPILEASLFTMGATPFSAPKGALGAGPTWANKKIGDMTNREFGSWLDSLIETGRVGPSAEEVLAASKAHNKAVEAKLADVKFGISKESGTGVSPVAKKVDPETQKLLDEINAITFDPAKPAAFDAQVNKVLDKVAGSKWNAPDPREPGFDEVMNALNRLGRAGSGMPAATKAPYIPRDPGTYSSSSPMTDMDFEHLLLSLPRGTPFTVPQAGKELGFNVTGVHATTKPPKELGYVPSIHGPPTTEVVKSLPMTPKFLEHDFGSFSLPRGEIGIHFGSPRAAQHFVNRELTNYEFPRKFPVVLRAQNPLEMPDLGSWGPSRIARQLEKMGWDSQEIAVARGTSVHNPARVPIEDQIQGLRDLIKSKGYDSIKYVNSVEDKGHTSYIMIDPSQIRSPWAMFDPAKVKSTDILAGLASGGLLVPIAGEQVRR